MKKNLLWMIAAILFCGLTAGALMACGDDKDEDDAQKDTMEALCHVMVSDDVLKVADITVHYLDVNGKETTERMTTKEWKKQWKTTTLPARIGVWAQMTPKSGLTEDNYLLKVVTTAGYYFISAKGGEWADGWGNVPDPYAEPERVSAADISGWFNRNTTAGCEVDIKGTGKGINVDFGGNGGEAVSPYNDFCIFIVSLFGKGPETCGGDKD